MALVAAHLNAGVIFWSGGDSVAIGIQPTYQLHPLLPVANNKPYGFYGH